MLESTNFLVDYEVILKQAVITSFKNNSSRKLGRYLISLLKIDNILTLQTKHIESVARDDLTSDTLIIEKNIKKECKSLKKIKI